MIMRDKNNLGADYFVVISVIRVVCVCVHARLCMHANVCVCACFHGELVCIHASPCVYFVSSIACKRVILGFGVSSR